MRVRGGRPRSGLRGGQASDTVRRMDAGDPLEPVQLAPEPKRSLLHVLAEARRRGLLGKAPLADHLANGEDFAGALHVLDATRVIDLGSGAGVPALVVALALPHVEVAMIERGAKRAAFLRDALASLGAAGSAPRVRVVEDAAEGAARSASWGGWADAVTARSFGPPSVVAECATRLVRVGGSVVVSEPPAGARDPTERWPAGPLRVLGLAPADRLVGRHTTLQILRRAGEPDARYPRRDAVTRKRPLF